VKALSGSKTRLLSPLGRDDLEALCLAMLEDVLTALLATPSLDRVAVATPDERVAELAQSLGAEALLGPDAGLNPAIDAAGVALGLGPSEPYLVVLGDVAGATPDDLQQLFDALGPTGAAMAPSSDGGTAALLRRPRDIIPSCFGPQSAARHREAARERSVTLAELALPSLAVDLDRAEDVELFLKGEGDGAKTRRALHELGWGRT
jgi:2-phospho-L-lactate guanylyltransferase